MTADRLAQALPEPAAWRTKHPSEPGMIGHYPWTYIDGQRRSVLRRKEDADNQPLFTADQMRAALAAKPAPVWAGDPSTQDYASTQAPAEGAGAVPSDADIEWPDIDDLAHSAAQEAYSFGISHDLFKRWMTSAMFKTASAIRAAMIAKQEADQPDVQPKGTAAGWLSLDSRPEGVRGAYLVRSKSGQVAPWINGVIHNAPGTECDWSYGEGIAAWMPFSALSQSPAPAPQGGVDCIDLALDLEARAKTVESQTTERAMSAAAHGLRLLASAQAPAVGERIAGPLAPHPIADIICAWANGFRVEFRYRHHNPGIPEEIYLSDERWHLCGKAYSAWSGINEHRIHADDLAAWEAFKRTATPEDAKDATRWRTFIGLDYAIRAEWAVNLSLVPVLTQWVDSAAAEEDHDAWQCERCNGDGWHWVEREGVEWRDKVHSKEHCEQCDGLGWLGPDATKAAAAKKAKPPVQGTGESQP